MRFRIIAQVVALALLAAGSSSAKDSPDQQRENIQKMAIATLHDLYKVQPESRTLIEKSAGYAVFDNMGTHLLLVSTARGSSVAVDSKAKRNT